MHRSQLAWAAAALVALGCSDASAPAGRAGTIAARAYIDRDASGTHTDADSALAGVSVAVLRDTTEVATAVTDAAGLASFPSLPPGGYTVRLGGEPPAGTVLASNPTPPAPVSFQGTAPAVEFRFAYLPGSVAGTVYRDDNLSGAFEAESDTPGAGLLVYLLAADAGAPGAVLDSVVADAAGAYRFPYVAPGSYWVRFENPTTIDFGAAGATRAVTVTARAAATVSGAFTGSLIIPVLEVRGKTVGQPVAVVGNVSVSPGSFTSGTGGVNSEIWVQDATGGIAVFSVPTADSLTYALGDLVEVSGTLGAFGGQLQISGPVVRELEGNTPVVARNLTGAQVNALGANEGLLVSVANVTVTAVGGGTGAAFNVTATDAAGEAITIRVAGLGTGLARESFVVGNRYNVTGILTQFNGTAQLKPRVAGDLVLAAAITPIATARASSGAVVTVVGNLTVPPGVFTSGSGGVNSEIWVQDATGGIAVFSVPSAEAANLALGDRVEVTGTVSAFNGQLQIGSGPTVVEVTGAAVVAPKDLTGVEVNALGANEGLLVSLGNFTVTGVGTASSSGAFNVDGTADGVAVRLRVNGLPTGLTPAEFTVGSVYAVTGILTQFNGTAQLKLRFRTDVTP